MFHFLFILQYIAANPGVQGAYMPQYPPLHAAPVSLLYFHRLPGVHLILCDLKIIVVLEYYCSTTPLLWPRVVFNLLILLNYQLPERKHDDYGYYCFLNESCCLVFQENVTPQQVDSSNNSSPYSQLSK